MVITIIPEGVNPLLWNAPKINAQHRSYSYRTIRARQWMRNAERKLHTKYFSKQRNLRYNEK